jgi:long-chain acyl-CoA synthetase
MNLAELLAEAGTRWGDRPALARGHRTIASYSVLAGRVAGLAGALRGTFRMVDGGRVAIAMRNAPQFAEVMLAAWHAGLTVVPMNAKLHPKEFAYILEDSGARLCFVTDDLAGAIEGAGGAATVVTAAGREYERLAEHAPVPVRPVAGDADAWLFYTSGTTGRPKGAVLTHRNLHAMIAAYFTDVDAISPADCIVHAAPMSHGSGLYLLPHLARGACQVVPESGGFDPDEVCELLRVHRGATLFLAPTMVMRLVDAQAAHLAGMENLKTIVYGGGPMYAEHCVRALEAIGPKLVQIYGQGESPMTITCLKREVHAAKAHPRFMHRLASVGVPFARTEVRLAGHDDAEVPIGGVGEILVRGDTVMKGYWQNETASRETLRGGWLHTGDMGSFDADGYLTLKDRSKDVIISGGSNIYPREVEEVLLQHPGVAEASVVGRPHPDWGEEVVAFVVPAPTARLAEAELDALCLANIARFKRPRVYRFVDGLPKNNYGKVLKTALRERLGDSKN